MVLTLNDTRARHTVHETLVDADPDTVYGLIADVAGWPHVFGPTVHVDLLREDAGEQLLHIWALANDEVRDWTYFRKDGSRVGVSLAVTAVREREAGELLAPGHVRREAGDGDTVVGFLFVGTDQSERVRAGELELARRRAEAASQAKSEFLSRVSHELRTPMNAMLGYAQLLQLEDVHRLDDFQRERVARIEAAGWHLVTLINDVLDLSTIESGNARIRMAEIDVAQVIEDSIRLVTPLAARNEVTVHAPPPVLARAGAWRAHADATRLRQVLVNVIGNAIKYNRRGGRVELALHDGAPGAGQLRLEISDTGMGMTPAQLARLCGDEAADLVGRGEQRDADRVEDDLPRGLPRGDRDFLVRGRDGEIGQRLGQLVAVNGLVFRRLSQRRLPRGSSAAAGSFLTPASPRRQAAGAGAAAARSAINRTTDGRFSPTCSCGR